MLKASEVKNPVWAQLVGRLGFAGFFVHFLYSLTESLTLFGFQASAFVDSFESAMLLGWMPGALAGLTCAFLAKFGSDGRVLSVIGSAGALAIASRIDPSWGLAAFSVALVLITFLRVDPDRLQRGLLWVWFGGACVGGLLLWNQWSSESATQQLNQILVLYSALIATGPLLIQVAGKVVQGLRPWMVWVGLILVIPTCIGIAQLLFGTYFWLKFVTLGFVAFLVGMALVRSTLTRFDSPRLSVVFLLGFVFALLHGSWGADLPTRFGPYSVESHVGFGRYLLALPVKQERLKCEPLEEEHTIQPPAPRAQNVILVIADAIRADEIYGENAAQYPNITQFKGEGASFTNAYAPSNKTMLSLPAILGASRPFFPTPGWSEEDYFVKSVSKLFERLPKPMVTAIFHAPLYGETDARLFVGFDKREVPGEHSDAVFGGALEFVENQAEGEPFFLVVYVNDAHAVYRCDDGREGGRECYRDGIRRVDRGFGKLRAALENDASNTLIVFTADHGEAFGEHGQYFHTSSLYDPQIKVPLILVGAGIPPEQISKPVDSGQLQSTILNMLGVAARDRLFGATEEPYAISHHSTKHRRIGVHKTALITEQHKVIYNWRTRATRLYDLKLDPNEVNDVSGSNPELLKGLVGKLYAEFGCSHPKQ